MSYYNAPKPANWDELVAAWDNPEAWARETAVYARQCGERLGTGWDFTESRRPNLYVIPGGGRAERRVS